MFGPLLHRCGKVTDAGASREGGEASHYPRVPNLGTDRDPDILVADTRRCCRLHRHRAAVVRRRGADPHSPVERGCVEESQRQVDHRPGPDPRRSPTRGIQVASFPETPFLHPRLQSRAEMLCDKRGKRDLRPSELKESKLVTAVVEDHPNWGGGASNQHLVP